MQDQQSNAELSKMELLNDRLSDKHKGKLFAFNQDKDMVEAVEIAMLYALNQMGVLKKDDSKIHDVNWAYSIGYNTNTSDELVGRALRERVSALSMLDDAFRQIKRFGVEEVKEEAGVNPAL